MKNKNTDPFKVIPSEATRFQTMLQNNLEYYFDVADFLLITDYFVEEKNVELAHRAIEMGKKQHPKSVDILIRYSQIISLFEMYDDSLAVLKTASTIDPSNSEVHYFLGVIYLKISNKSLAEKSFDQAEKLAETSNEKSQVLGMIGFELARTGEEDQAIHFLKKGILEDPKNDFAQAELVNCFETLGRLEDGVVFFQEMTDNYPFNYYSWYYLGVLFSKQEKHDLAIKAYDYSIINNQDYANAHFNQANAFYETGNYEAALKAFFEVIRLEPEESATWLYCGECHEQMGDNDKALAYYLNSIKYDGQESFGYYKAALMHFQREDFQEAKNYIKTALKLEGTSTKYWILNAKILSASGEIKKILKSIEKVAKIDPLESAIYPIYADAIFNKTKSSEAIEFLTNAFIKFPNDPAILFRLAVFSFVIGDHDDGNMWLEMALGTDNFNCDSILDMYPFLDLSPEIMDLLGNYLRDNLPDDFNPVP